MKYTSQSHVWKDWTPAVGTVLGSHEAIGTIVCGQIWSIEIESYSFFVLGLMVPSPVKPTILLTN